MGVGEERTDGGRRSVGRKALGTRVTESGTLRVECSRQVAHAVDGKVGCLIGQGVS